MPRTLGEACARVTIGALVGIAVFWIVAIWQVREGEVADWLMPVALVTGIGAALAWRLPPVEQPRSASWPRWLAFGLIAAALVAVTWGALATPSRHWDGAASLDAKVFWLTRSPTLQQPFFTADGVFHHSPDYPLLLPLLVAMLERLLPGCGRLVLPAMWLLLLGAFAAGLRGRLTLPWLAPLATAGLALTPALLTPGGGAVDSGYSDVLLAATTTLAAAGLLRRKHGLVALSAVLMVAAKPEGTVYVAILCAAAFAIGNDKTLRFAALPACLALLLWWPTRTLLLEHRSDLTALPILVLNLTAIALSTADEWLQRRGPARTLRLTLALGVPLAALLALPLLANALPRDGGTFSVYLAHADQLWHNLGNIPAWALALVDFGVLRLRFGAALLLPALAAFVALWRGVRIDAPTLGWFCGLGLLSTLLPFLLSPEPDLDHHLRSSLPRLLLHWLGPWWLLGTALLDRLMTTHD